MKYTNGTRAGAGSVCSSKAVPAVGLAAGANSVVESGSGVVVVGGPAEQKIV